MPDVLMSPEKMPAKFSMADEDEGPPRPPGPQRRRMVRLWREAVDRIRDLSGPPQRRPFPTSAAAW